MKVEFNPTIQNQKTNFLTRVRKFISAKLKPLGKDTFEKTTVEQTEKKIIVSRKNPNWCVAPEDGYRNNTVAQRICYYPEDVKKMETMSKKEIFEYKDYLDNIGRFYYDDGSYHVDTPALDKLTEEYGIDLNQFIVKD